jgi:hypothetical protein
MPSPLSSKMKWLPNLPFTFLSGNPTETLLINNRNSEISLQQNNEKEFNN